MAIPFYPCKITLPWPVMHGASQVTVHFLPAPGFVLSCQLGVAALTMRVCGSLGYLEVDHIEWVKFKRFVWVIIGFLGTIFCNIKVRKQAKAWQGWH